MDQTYEEKSPLTVICRYDQVFLSNGGGLPFAVVPTPEDIVQDWSEGDPSLHYFFAEIDTDISAPMMDVEEYQALQEAEAEGEEVDAPA